MIKCGECGYENTDGLDYCDGCGAKLDAAAGAGASSAASAGTSGAAAAAVASEPPAAVAGERTEATPAVDGGASPTPAESAPAEHAEADSKAAEAPVSPKAPTGDTSGTPAAAAAAAVAGAPFKAKLAILRGGRRGQEFELEAGNSLVGRWDPETGAFPEVDLDADDPEAKISRKHALIRIEAGKITIEDIGSLNGTYVNRQPRLQPGNPVDLKDGDEIIIGKTFMKLSINPIS
ncbi:MAG TPA: FHA domain-containing protein [Candidatus Binataceae bacterium]|nr:FHA domain-containing protein [Candidatus Binataceae bacterium]